MILQETYKPHEARFIREAKAFLSEEETKRLTATLVEFEFTDDEINWKLMQACKCVDFDFNAENGQTVTICGDLIFDIKGHPGYNTSIDGDPSYDVFSEYDVTGIQTDGLCVYFGSNDYEIILKK